MRVSSIDETRFNATRIRDCESLEENDFQT